MNNPPGISQQQINQSVIQANILYFRSQVFNQTEWMGVKAAKCPMDMWVYQELMFRLKTDLLIETGTWLGGSALYFAHLFDLMGRGRVMTVDIEKRSDLPQHDRIEYLHGSSLDDDIVDRFATATRQAKSVLVILDSDHKKDHKLAELKRYAPLVTPGSYLIAEDSCFDYFPAWPEFGAGPASAVREFMRDNNEFEIDRQQERHLLTFAPIGFLRRKA
jgi:cephalosporin hydroxylase